MITEPNYAPMSVQILNTIWYCIPYYNWKGLLTDKIYSSVHCASIFCARISCILCEKDFAFCIHLYFTKNLKICMRIHIILSLRRLFNFICWKILFSFCTYMYLFLETYPNVFMAGRILSQGIYFFLDTHIR